MNARRAEHARLLAEQARARSTAVEAVRSRVSSSTSTSPDDVNREAMLRRRAVRLPRYEIEPIRDIVIETMLSVPAWTEQSDLHGVSYLMRFAASVYQREGYFDPATQMDDARITSWVEEAYVQATPATKQSAYSSLQRIRDGRHRRGPQRRSSRPFARAPHTATQWARFEAAASHLGDTPIGRSVRMLLDLTGEIGLRPDEVQKADGTWIEIRKSHVVVVAVNHYGVVREIPAFGPVAARLRRRAESRELLVLPNKLNARRNVINAVTRQADGYSHGALDGYSATSARNRWLVGLMQRSLPFATLAAVADINPGNHVLTDLLPYLPALDPRDAAATYRNHHQNGGQR